MLLALTATLVLGQVVAPSNPRGPIINSGLRLALFEFAPTAGRGMGLPCACTAITGAKGEAVTITRASNVTCTKGSESAIADGDLVVCGNNLPAVGNPDGLGLALLQERAKTNTALRSSELCNAAWADVGTPACASDQAAGPFGTATMDLFTDNSAAAFEGRSQAITTGSQTQHTFFCYVKAGTATSASVTIVGTGNSAGNCTGTLTGLSTTTSRPVSCSSTAAFGAGLTAVTVSVRVGTVVGDQGTLYVEGCDHAVDAPSRSSHVPTGAAAATRAAGFPDDIALAWPAVTTGFSLAGTFIAEQTVFAAGNSATPVTLSTNAVGVAAMGTVYCWPFTGTSAGGSYSVDCTGAASGASGYTGTETVTPGGTSRLVVYHTGALLNACANGVCPAGVASTWLSPAFQRVRLGAAGTGTTSATDGWIRGVCVDPDPARCR